MSLDNVFMGKKVVQQIYLKNALIYQSKGWETLPSAPQVEWTKSYDNKSKPITDSAIDQNSNIYVCSQESVCKIDADGTLVWSMSFPNITSIKVCVDENTNVYVALVNGSCLEIKKLAPNGTTLCSNSNFNLKVSIINAIVIDNSNLYISGKDTDSFLCKFDKDLKIIQQTAISANALMTTNESPYLFFCQGGYLESIEKKDIEHSSPKTLNSKAPYGLSSNDSYILDIVLDNLGNIFYTTNYLGTYKYKASNQEIIKWADSTTKMLCIDYQQNLYCIKRLMTSDISIYSANLIKTSSDGTLIYNSQIAQNENIFTIGTGQMLVDNNGNIYLIYKKTSGELLITKIINLVKKGN